MRYVIYDPTTQPRAVLVRSSAVSEAKPMGVLGLVRVLFTYIRRYRGLSTLLVLALLLDVGFDTALRLSFKFLLDDVIAPHDRRLLALTLGALGVGAIVASCAMVGRDYIYARLSANVLNDIRLDMFSHLQRLGIGFYTEALAGDVIARFSTDLAAIEGAISYGLGGGAMAIMGIVFSLVPLFLLEWRLALVALVGLPLALIAARLLTGRATAASYEVKEGQARLVSIVEENVGAQPVVKAFGLEGGAIARFREEQARLFGSMVRFGLLSGLVERAPNVVVLLLNLVILAIGAFLVFEGRMTVGTLVSFSVLFQSLSNWVQELTFTVPYLLQAAGGMQRLQELLDEAPAVQDVAGAGTFPRLERDLVFDRVAFSYDGGRRILDDVSFTIPKGTWAAFVGPSGSGKSTVLSLVLRFYDPTEGSVRIDGKDLRSGTQSSLREQIGVVLQDSLLFNTTIRENVRVGRRSATDAAVDAAAKAARIGDLAAALGKGYDTPVGEHGSRLSGGQRQRVAIARALVRDPALLVLDEATSALDAGTESAINATLAEVGKGRTVLSVTHRLASAATADTILVFDNGRLVEQGRHAELIEKRGAYAKLWEKQSGFVLSDAGDRASVEVSRLRSLPFLKDLDETLLTDLASLFVTERQPADRVLFEAGDPADRFYLIVRGAVEALRPGSVNAERIAMFSDGDHFGEIALLRDMPRLATVRTLTPCIFLTLLREHFHVLVSRAPELRASLERAIIEMAETFAAA